MAWAPVLFLSADDRRVARKNRICDLVTHAYGHEPASAITTGVLNDVLADAPLAAANSPASGKGRRLKIHLRHPAKPSQPPTFVLFVNEPSAHALCLPALFGKPLPQNFSVL